MDEDLICYSSQCVQPDSSLAFKTTHTASSPVQVLIELCAQKRDRGTEFTLNNVTLRQKFWNATMNDRKWLLHFQHGYSVETSVVVGLLILSLQSRGERSISHDGLFASDPFVSLLL